MNNTTNYKDLLIQHLDDVEGFSPTVYKDSEGNNTIAHGLNIDDPANQNLLRLFNRQPESLHEGEEITEAEGRELQNHVFNRKEDELKNKIGEITFNQLKPNEQAAMMSMAYQSMNLIGPKIVQYLNENKTLDANKEILLNSNAGNHPGIQLRRLKEAMLFSDPIQFQNVVNTLNDEEKQRVMNNLKKLKEEGQRNDALKKYTPFFENSPKIYPFLKLKKLIK